PGALNLLPDALSRQFPQELWNDRPPTKGPLKIHGYMHMIMDEDNPRDVVPESERDDILAEAHDLAHSGANAMVNFVHSQNKTWPHLSNDCV
ncbi:hypothetical protein BGZ79_006542, partial [Entomortierella chlamydospora]